MSTAMLGLLTLLALLAVPQTDGQAPSISLDGSRPYVEIVFERLGPRIPVFAGEGKRGLWLRVRNNCVLPIEAHVLPGSGGNPGLLLPHEVIEELGEMKGLAGLRPSISKPRGYRGPDVVNLRNIGPGKDLLFSVPLNHVTREWLLRVEVHLVIPSPTRGNQPRTFVEFDWSQLPMEAQMESDQELYGKRVK